MHGIGEQGSEASRFARVWQWEKVEYLSTYAYVVGWPLLLCSVHPVLRETENVRDWIERSIVVWVSVYYNGWCAQCSLYIVYTHLLVDILMKRPDKKIIPVAVIRIHTFEPLLPFHRQYRLYWTGWFCCIIFVHWGNCNWIFLTRKKHFINLWTSYSALNFFFW